MKVEIVSVAKFDSGPVTLRPGDLIRCSHEYFDNEDGVITTKETLCSQEVTEEALWDRSILFRLDGELCHIIGNAKTQAWLEGLK